MYHHNKVVWTEGLLLSPQHFQQQDRHFDYLIKQQVMHHHAYYWGIIDYKIDTELLKMGKISLSSCRAIMNDGTYISAPEHTAAPPIIDIQPGTSNITVYLGMPTRQVDEKKTGINHTVIDIYDNASNNHQQAEIQIEILPIKLLTENDLRTGYLCVKIANIKECRADTGIVLDEDFIPSCININASEKLQKFHQEIIAMLQHRSKILAQQITQATQTVTVETTDYLLLGAINANQPCIQHLAHLPHCHPEKLYLHLIHLLGELTTYTQKDKYCATYPIYQHNDLQATFSSLMTALREALSVIIDQQLIFIPFEKRAYGIFVATINDKSLLHDADFILAVHSELPKDKITVELPLQIKIASTEQIREIISRALPGIKIKPLFNLPPNLPFSIDTVYFSIDQESHFWEELNHASGFAIQLNREYLDCDIKCWAMRRKKRDN